jgi:heme A synthase
MTLYLVQTALVSAKRVAWHRSLGTIAFCLPPIMLVLGTITAIDGLRRGITIGPLPSDVSMAIPLLGMVLFAILITAAWRTRRKPDSHKRYILYATIGLCDAALGRFPWRQIGLTPGGGAVLALGIVLLIPLAYDLISLYRIHRASLWAAPLAFALGAFSAPIGMTPVWHGFAAFLAHYIAP